MATLWFYLAVFAVTIIRGIGLAPPVATTHSGILLCLLFIVVVWFAYRLLASARTDEERWLRLVALALSPAAFVAFNLVIMKVRLPLVTVPAQARGSANGQAATFLGAFGVHTTRSNLPLASGVNGSGAISAAGFAAAAILALRARWPSRYVTVTAAALCAYSTLLSDSHAALLIALVVVALFAVLPRMHRLSWVGLVAAVSPAIVVASLGLVSSLGLGFVGRGGGGSAATADNRVYIWKAVWSTIRHSDLYHVIFGYGAYGQVSSGASRVYGALFEGVTLEPLLNTAHDLPLQTLLDGGVVALAALAMLGVAVLSSLGRAAVMKPSAPVQALMAIFIVLLLNGATEALPSYQFPESLGAILLVAGAALALPPMAVVEPMRKRSRPVTTRSGPAVRLGATVPSREI